MRCGAKMKKISIIIPVYNVDHKRFKKTLDSLVNQTSDDFEVCISDGGLKSDVKTIVDEYSEKLDIKYDCSEKNLGISDNTNAALKLANGEYISFLDHDDILEATAIEDVINIINEKNPDVIYSDEQIIDEKGKVLNKFYKPDFSQDLLYSQNYICHFLVVKKSIVEKVGDFKSKYDGAQDYDYILRITEETKNICHLPKILYNWLSTEESTAQNSDAKPYAQKAGLDALDAHLKRVYGNIAHAEETDYLFVYQARFDLLKNKKVDIIIPMKDKWYLTKECVESIISKTTYENYQITIIDNGSQNELTFKWFDEVKKLDKRVRVINANFEFNWSKLQNFGINNSDAEVFVFLNNDTIIIEENWLELLCENALRDEVGVVGPLLLYEDGTIQHGGVVLGLNGYADHLYKEMNPVHAGVTFVSPMVSRNVLALTGACMAISRKTIDKIGGFDENFIICGSDIEMCLRAYEAGYRNIYIPYTKLIHLESKSRDAYIPDIDYKFSKILYTKYWKNGDPFYNPNLDYESCIPIEKSDNLKKKKMSKKEKIKNFFRGIKPLVSIYRFTRKTLLKSKLAVKIYRKIRHIEIKESPKAINYTTSELKDITPYPTTINKKYRINILIPTLNKDKVFGGIATAMKFFNQFNDKNFEKRIVIIDLPTKSDDLDNYPDYTLIDCLEKCDFDKQVVFIGEKGNCNLLVAENDIFIATAWWTAYNIKPVIDWQKNYYNMDKYNKLIYFIQDYEPYFYPWSSKYCCAEKTYHLGIPTTAVFNSKELMDYFEENNYSFENKYYFSPILNDKLKDHLLNDKERERKKQIVVYGRPGTYRNAFEIIVEALMKAFKERDDVQDWKVISMGEEHSEAIIKDNATVKSVGKLSLDDYAKTMEESYMGISLMVSPHPSYPPLEMSSFGIKTITNNFANKDISYFNDNIISVENCDADSISEEITKLLDNFDEISKKQKKTINKDYVNASDQFTPIIKGLIKEIEGKQK